METCGIKHVVGVKMEKELQSKEKMYLLPESLGNAIIDYLSQHPFKDVGLLINGLMSLQQHEGESDAD